MTAYGQLAWRPTGKPKTAVLVGIIEAPKGSLEPAGLPARDVMMTFAGNGGLERFSGVTIGVTIGVGPTPEGEERALSVSEVGFALMLKMWNGSAGTHDVIQLLIRKSSAEAEREGHELFMVAGMAQTVGPMADMEHGWLDIERDADGTFRALASSRDPGPLEAWRGMNHGQILKEPVWGWGDEPWAVTSTMREGFQRDCQELQGYLARTEILGETLEDGEASRMSDLMMTEARGVINIKPGMEPAFRKYMEMVLERDGIEGMNGFLGKRSESEIRSKGDNLKAFVRHILNMDEGMEP